MSNAAFMLAFGVTFCVCVVLLAVYEDRKK
jgi:hypothetical protein